MQPSRATPFHPSHHQTGYRARLDWGQTGVRLLARQADLVVVVDVLSFSTAVSVAVEHCATMSPYRVRDATAEVYARRAGGTLASPDRDNLAAIS